MRQSKSAARMRSIIVFAVLALGASILVPRYAARLSTAPAPVAPVALAARPVAAATATANSRSVIVPRDGRGHFQVDGRVDGRRLSFMIDTGASVIALTASDAARLGIHPAQREFVTEVKTANGTVRAAPTRLDMVEVGDLVVRDVTALVLPDEALSDNLLGLSFLSRLRRFEYSNGQLVLEQ
jgi:aspartyl protease family protein